MTNWLSPNPFQQNAREDVRNIDQLAAMFGLPDFDSVEEMNLDYIADAGRGIEDDEEQMEAMTAARDELYRNWHQAVLSTAEQLFEEHSLELDPIRYRRDLPDVPAYEFRIVPEESWSDAARKIMQTINGVGMFHFGSLKEFLDSGPYTPRQAVLSHLGYIRDYPKVYGTMMSAQQIYEGSWR